MKSVPGDHETVRRVQDESDVFLRHAVVVQDGPQGDVGLGVVVEGGERLLAMTRFLLLRCD